MVEASVSMGTSALWATAEQDVVVSKEPVPKGGERWAPMISDILGHSGG
jgi:hypothetical protein